MTVFAPFKFCWIHASVHVCMLVDGSRFLTRFVLTCIALFVCPLRSAEGWEKERRDGNSNFEKAGKRFVFSSTSLVLSLLRCCFTYLGTLLSDSRVVGRREWMLTAVTRIPWPDSSTSVTWCTICLNLSKWKRTGATSLRCRWCAKNGTSWPKSFQVGDESTWQSISKRELASLIWVMANIRSLCLPSRTSWRGTKDLHGFMSTAGIWVPLGGLTWQLSCHMSFAYFSLAVMSLKAPDKGCFDWLNSQVCKDLKSMRTCFLNLHPYLSNYLHYKFWGWETIASRQKESSRKWTFGARASSN